MLPIRLLAHGAFALSLLAATSPAIALAPQPVSTAAFEAGVVGLSYSPKTSADGRYTVFQSFAVNLVTPVDPKAPPNIYLHDAVSNTVSLVSGIDGGNRSGDSGSDSPAISADGSTIAFISTSSNLKPGVEDDADSADLFVFHRPTATLELVTRVEGGNRAAGGAEYEPMAFSADGRYLVFVSGASNLVAGMSDSADTRDVFLYDRVTKGVVPVSAVEGSNTASSNAFWSAGSPSISADGNFIAFQTSATDLKPGVTDDGFGSDIYLYNRSSRALTLVSGVNGGNTTGNGSSSTPAISGDGRFVAFSTEASNLKPSVADNNGTTDIYVYNRLTPGLALVSGIDGGNTTGNGFATGSIAISADGGFIAFISTASNLKSGVSDGNGEADVYLYNRASPSITLASGINGGSTTSSYAGARRPFGVKSVSISSDGTRVAFISSASDLKPGFSDNNTVDDVFVYHRTTSSLALASGIDGSNTAGNAPFRSGASDAAISADGRFVSYISNSKNILSGEGVPPGIHVFRYSVNSPGQQRLTRHASGAAGTMAAGSSLIENPRGQFSADGRYLVFTSSAVNLVPGQIDQNSARDVFLYDAVTGSTALVSGIDGGKTTGNGLSIDPVISADGNYVAFESLASNLKSGVVDSNGLRDIYLYSRATGSLALITGVDGGNTAAAIASSPDAELSISADGRYIVFLSAASNLKSGVSVQPFERDIYVHDRVANNTELVSGVDGGNVSGDGDVSGPVISANGRYIAFSSSATNLDSRASGFGSFTSDVYVHDRVARKTALASGINGGKQASGGGGNASISDDGSLIAFSSNACDLAPGVTCDPNTNSQTNQLSSIYIHDRVAGSTMLASGVDGGNTRSNASTYRPLLSGNGRYVAFLTQASNLAGGVSDTNELEDIYLFDRIGRRAVLVTGIDGGPTSSRTHQTYDYSEFAMSADAGSIVFLSAATDLVGGNDSGEKLNPYLFNRVAARTELLSARDGGRVAGNNHSYQVTVSADGSTAAFTTDADDLKSGTTDYSPGNDVYRVGADRVPDAFSFADQSDVTPGSVVISLPVTLGGLDASAPVSVTGGQYSLNEGSFTASPGTVVNGDVLRLRHTASGARGTATNTTVTVGGVSDTFTSTTELGSGANAFNFVERSNVTANVFITSERLTISGYAGELSLSVSEGGQYSLNGAAFTASSGVIAAGSTLSVRHVSASGAGEAKETLVTVGDYSTFFRTVTTSLDRTPDAFSFGTKLGATGGALVESEAITLTGYDSSLGIQPGNGIEYSLDGGTKWSRATGRLAVGQSIKVRHTASPNRGGYTKTSLKIGGVTGTFTTRSK